MPAVKAVDGGSVGARAVCVSADPSPSVHTKCKDEPNALALMCRTEPTNRPALTGLMGLSLQSQKAHCSHTTQ